MRYIVKNKKLKNQLLTQYTKSIMEAIDKNLTSYLGECDANDLSNEYTTDSEIFNYITKLKNEIERFEKNLGTIQPITWRERAIELKTTHTYHEIAEIFKNEGVLSDKGKPISSDMLRHNTYLIKKRLDKVNTLE